MTDSNGDLVERTAKAIAYWDGVKFTHRASGGPTHTVASRAGYGHFWDASERYANENWKKYEDQARGAIATVLDDMTDADATTLEAFYRAMDEARRGEHGFLDSVSAGLNAIIAAKRAELGL